MPPGPGTKPQAPQGFQPARDPEGPLGMLRIILGLFVVLVLILTALALVNSFFLEPPAPQGPRSPTPQPGGQQGGGGGGIECTDVAKTLQISFFVLAGLTVTLFAVAIARRHKSNGRIATSVWGVLATITFFFALVALGAWRITDFFCDGNPNCLNLTNGTWTTFLSLFGMTVFAVAIGMFLAHRYRRNFVLTGWGLIGVVLYVPTILTGFFWYMVRLMCTPRLSCALRDQFLETLAWTFWLSLVGGLAAIGIGYLVQRRFKLNMFATGWAILGILFLVLAAGAGYGWNYVSDIRIPYCDEIPPDEPQNQTPPTCQEIKESLQKRIRLGLWLSLGAAAATGGAAGYFHRKNWKAAFKSGWAVAAYLALALAVMFWLLLLLTDSMCAGEDGDNIGDGNGNIGNGGGGSSGGGGGGGGGRGGGGGGGGGGIGSAPVNIPINLGAIPLVWVLVIIGIIVGAALLVLLFKHKRHVEALDLPAIAPPEVDAKERGSLLRILNQPDLASRDAVIAAYRSYLAWCADRGMAKESYETPREHAQRVRDRYPVPEKAMDAFVRAYEVARLSDRPPTPSERQQAVAFSQEIDKAAWRKPEGEA